MTSAITAPAHHWVTTTRSAGPAAPAGRGQAPEMTDRRSQANDIASAPQAASPRTIDPETEVRKGESTRAALEAQEAVGKAEARKADDWTGPVVFRLPKPSANYHYSHDALKSYPPGTDLGSIPELRDLPENENLGGFVRHDGTIDIVEMRRVHFSPSDPRDVLDGTDEGFQRYVRDFEETQSANAELRYEDMPTRKNSEVYEHYEAHFLDDDNKGAALIEKDGKTIGVVYEDGRLNMIEDHRQEARDLSLTGSWQDIAATVAERFGADIAVAPVHGNADGSV